MILCALGAVPALAARKPVLVPQFDQIVAAGDQTVKWIAPVWVVLFDDKVLAATGQAGIDDLFHRQVAFADLGELHRAKEDIALPCLAVSIKVRMICGLTSCRPMLLKSNSVNGRASGHYGLR